MEESIANKITLLNQEFYQTFAKPFAATRQRIQPGVRKVLETFPNHNKIIDLGCGNGELWSILYSRGFQGKYLGIDFSQELLEFATREEFQQVLAQSPQEVIRLMNNPSNNGIFYRSDLTEATWDKLLPRHLFDTAISFAVLHHIPSKEKRRQILLKIHNLLKPGGIFWHSEWQFMNSERLKARIQPWSQVSLQDNQVDPGDYLLDWRQGGHGYRYVHLYNLDELAELAEESQFKILETFFSDGKENNLAVYQQWKAVE